MCTLHVRVSMHIYVFEWLEIACFTEHLPSGHKSMFQKTGQTYSAKGCLVTTGVELQVNFLLKTRNHFKINNNLKFIQQFLNNCFRLL